MRYNSKTLVAARCSRNERYATNNWPGRESREIAGGGDGGGG